MDWSIQLYYDKTLDPVFINDLFYFLISRGTRYNAYKFKGRYNILSEEPENDIEYTEEELSDSTEKLRSIIDTYLKFDLKTTHFSIFLNYIGEVKFCFSVYLIPTKDSGCLISFEAGEHLISDEKTFLVFINLCKDVFVRFNLVYGSFRSEYQGYIPVNEDAFLRELPDIVNFYSKSLVEKIDRDKLISAPARKVEELENGGIMLLVCTNQLGCPEELEKVRRHLGFK